MATPISQFPSLPSVLNQQTKLLMSPMVSVIGQYEAIKDGASGDPMWNQPITGTTYNWNDLTQLQGLAWEWYMTNSNLPATVQKGVPTDANLQQVLDQSRGPNVFQNWSYNQWIAAGYPVSGPSWS